MTAKKAPPAKPRRQAAQRLSTGDYRELLALIEALGVRVDETRDDAREARDAARALSERLGAQDIPSQLVELRGHVDAGFVAARTDLVNAMDKITREARTGHDDHETRLKALEAFRSRIEGAGGVVTWLSKNAPWLVAIGGFALAALGWKDKL